MHAGYTSAYTGGSCLSWIFWEHENLSGLSVIRLIQIMQGNLAKKSGLSGNPA